MNLQPLRQVKKSVSYQHRRETNYESESESKPPGTPEDNWAADWLNSKSNASNTRIKNEVPSPTANQDTVTNVPELLNNADSEKEDSAHSPNANKSSDDSVFDSEKVDADRSSDIKNEVPPPIANQDTVINAAELLSNADSKKKDRVHSDNADEVSDDSVIVINKVDTDSSSGEDIAKVTNQPSISASRSPGFIREYPGCAAFLALALCGATAGAIYATTNAITGGHAATGSNPSDTPIQRLTTFIGNWLYDCKFLENADKCMSFAEKIVSTLIESYGERTSESFADEPMWAECPSNWTLANPLQERDFRVALNNVDIRIEEYRALHRLPLPSDASAVIVQWLATMAALAIFALLQG